MSDVNEIDYVDVEFWAIVDEDGEYHVGLTADDAESNYDAEVGGGTSLARRVVQVKIRVPQPVPAVVEATLPPEPSAAVVKVA
jgi:hypothetical protein